jgi:ABC-type Na+ efflux pump permease subunit
VNLFRSSIIKDLRRFRRDPTSIMISVMVPLLIGILVKLVSSGGGVPTARLLVADEDDSFLSGFLVNTLDQGPLEDLIVTELVSQDEGRRRMDEGEASGLLIIPEGFGNDVLVRTPTTLILVKNPAQRILPGILEETFASMAGVINLGHQVLGPTAQPFLEEFAESDTPSDELVASVSIAFNQLIRRVEPFLMPPAIEVETVYLKSAMQSRSFAEIFFPSMLFLAIIFAVQGMSDDIWKERLQGTLRRTVSTPGNLSAFLLGKIVASTIVLLLISTLAMVIARWGLFMPLSNLALAIPWVALSGVFMLFLFITLQMMATTQRGGNMMTSAFLFPLAMIGGSFFPFEAMPDWMAAIGKMTPNGWALARFKDIVAGTLEPVTLLITAAGLLLVSFLMFGICLKRLSAFARNV